MQSQFSRKHLAKSKMSVRGSFFNCLIAGLIFWAIPGNAQNRATQPDAQPQKQVSFKLDLEFGKPVSYKNLTIFPLISKTPNRNSEFLTLDQALKAGLIKVVEGSVIDDGGNGAANNPANSNNRNLNPPGNQNNNRQSGNRGNGNQSNVRVRSRQNRVQQQETQQANQESANQTQSANQQEQTDGRQEQRQQSEHRQQTGNQDRVRNPQRQQGSLNPALNLQQQIGEINPQNFQGGNQVNRVYVVNESDKSIYLMPGEIILGGDQDRIIAQETIIPPGTAHVPVSVFCVESGRWGQREESTTNQALEIIQKSSKGDVAFNKKFKNLAQASNQGQFIGSIGNVSNPVRMACQLERQQQRVWANVDIQNRKSNLNPKSKTFTSNYSTGATLKQINEFIDATRKPVADQENVVGVIICVNGKVVSLDVFRSPALFSSLWPKMSKSFSLEAATDLDPKVKKHVAPKMEVAQAFLDQATKGKLAKIENNRDVQVQQIENQQLVCFVARQQPPATSKKKPQLIHITAFPAPEKSKTEPQTPQVPR